MWQCLSNPDKLSRDVVICAVPWTDTDIPMMAPAALKPIVERAGLTCLAVDLNQEVYQYTRDHQHKDHFVRFFFDEILHPDIQQEANDLFESIAKDIVSYQPRWLGLSLLSYVCQVSAKWIAYHVRKLDPSIGIIFGGAGCLPTFTGPSPYIEKLRQQNLVDYHIRGDGENSLYELLTGNTDFDGINDDTWRQLTNDDLAQIPMPDYSDYHLNIYRKKTLPLIGNRGCVRQCTFCDYIANWKRFQWRTADHIFDEMLQQHERYGVRHFKFQDALINGNVKEFTRLTQLLAEYNTNNPDRSFSWSSFYIFREVTASSERDWELVAKSGADTLFVGIENFNQHIRYAMGKKFSNESIDFHLAQAQRWHVTCVLGNIVGYVNETQADIDFIKHWLRTHTQFRDIAKLQWGGTLGIFPNTYLERNQQELGIIMIGTTPQQWINPRIDSNPGRRAHWAQELITLSRQLGYTVFDELDNHFILEKLSNG